MKTPQEVYDLYMCPAPDTNQVCYYKNEGEGTVPVTVTLDISAPYCSEDNQPTIINQLTTLMSFTPGFVCWCNEYATPEEAVSFDGNPFDNE